MTTSKDLACFYHQTQTCIWEEEPSPVQTRCDTPAACEASGSLLSARARGQEMKVAGGESKTKPETAVSLHMTPLSGLALAAGCCAC